MATSTVPPGDPDYPSGLDAIGSPVLFVRGTLPKGAGVAVVGTRHPSTEALAFTRDLARGLVAAEIAVWSGGAIGIDAAAHEAALEAGGITVVVAGGGLDRPYPAEHAPLFQAVIDGGGALVARVRDGTPPQPAGFLQRNAVLAAATVATIVVQAGLVSGARSTAAAARRLGRRLLVVPHAPWDEIGRGCALELARGAVVITRVDDVLAALGRPPPPAKPRRRRESARSLSLPLACAREIELEAPDPTPLAADEARILTEIAGDPLHVDDLCERTGLPAHRVTAAVLTLTLRAVVVEAPPGFVRRLLLSTRP